MEVCVRQKVVFQTCGQRTESARRQSRRWKSPVYKLVELRKKLWGTTPRRRKRRDFNAMGPTTAVKGNPPPFPGNSSTESKMYLEEASTHESDSRRQRFCASWPWPLTF